jgi:hypothetical protein
MLRFLAQALLIIVVFVAAWRRGGEPERYVASIYLAMLVVSAVNAFSESAHAGADYTDVKSLHFTLDALALLGVVIVALRYDRWWTLWVGSVQFIAVMAHVLRMLNWPMPPIAYAVMERWPVWLAVILTGVGTCLQVRRSRGTPTGT